MKYLQYNTDNILYNRLPLCGQLYNQLKMYVGNSVYYKMNGQLYNQLIELSTNVYNKVHGNL